MNGMGPRHSNERTLGQAQRRKIFQTGIAPKISGLPQYIIYTLNT